MNEPKKSPNPDSQSPGSAPVVPEAVRRLLEQRDTYRQWLARLDDLGSEYRSEVAERVRTDYVGRLDGVGEELEGHRQELETRREDRRGRQDELAGSYEARSTELEEAELRYQVGEFDESEWEKRRTELTAGIEEIEAELSGAREAVGALEAVLAELAAPPDAPSERTIRRAGGNAPRREANGRALRRPPSDAGLAAAEMGRAEAEGGDETGLADDPAGDAADGDAADDPDDSAAETSSSAAGTGDGGSAGTGRADAVPERETETAEAAPEIETASAPEAETETAEAAAAESDEFMDELEFLESLSLDDTDSFDAVSRMLEDEEDR